MEITIYGENRLADPHLFVHYAVELKSEPELIEIFRQVLPYMPRYEPGDVIKFRLATDAQGEEARYVVDRVVNYVVCLPTPTKQLPQFQNQIYVILKPQPLAEGSELNVRKLQGAFDATDDLLFRALSSNKPENAGSTPDRKPRKQK